MEEKTHTLTLSHGERGRSIVVVRRLAILREQVCSRLVEMVRLLARWRENGGPARARSLVPPYGCGRLEACPTLGVDFDDVFVVDDVVAFHLGAGGEDGGAPDAGVFESGGEVAVD